MPKIYILGQKLNRPIKKSQLEIEIQYKFKDLDSFTRAELFELISKYDPELNNRTIGWRVFDLKKKNIIHSVGRGIYKISDKLNYAPLPDEEIRKISDYLNKEFYNLEYVIWNSSWLNEFSIHQTFNNFMILEVASDIIESVYFKLLKLGLKEVFMKPGRDDIYYKVLQADKPLIIKALITRSPNQKVNKIHFPSIEKIIVDIYTDVNIFYMYQGNELETIMQSIFDKYNVNTAKMMNYAKRRNKGEDLKDYLNNNIDNKLGI